MMEGDDMWADMDDFWDNDISDLMELSDAELVRVSAASRDKKIMSIRQQSLNGKLLSEKQRCCLAFWIDEHHPDFT